jgi:translation initiation factor 6 (eIF-6)
MYDIEKIQWTGFLAQDVEAAAKKINYDFSGIDKSGELMGLRYSSFVMPIVKSIQELDDRDERQEERVKYLEEENTALTNRIENLEKIINRQGIVLNDATEEIYKQSAIIENETGVATLSQNVPNPFTGNTSIAYFVPETAQQAHIKIANAIGVALFMAEVRIGNGVLEVDATQLAAGTYSYTLLVDGKVVDTKLMVIQ